MYSQSIIDKTLDDFEAENKWRPEFKSVEEVDDLIGYIDSLLDVNSNNVNRYFNWKPGKQPSKATVEWIQRQILNEQFSCFASAEYFVTRYGRIRTVDERIIRIQYRKAQKIFHSILAEYDEKQFPIQLFILKARQVGVSTVVAFYFLHRILFRSNTHAIMASAQAEQTNKLRMMLDTTWERLPFWLPPTKTSTKLSEPRWANGGALSLQAGSQTVGIGQGSTPTCLHLSEIADYLNPKKTIEEGLFPNTHRTAALFFVLEGTGSTASPWQKEKWDFYKGNWGKGGRFQTLFIPPSCADDIYPTDDFLRELPIPESWRPIEETLRMKRRGELFIRSTPYLMKHMGANWTMGRGYMWFWECGWKEAINSHTEKTFLSQNAVTDDDAFQSKQDPIFSTEMINVISNRRERKYVAYAITGKNIIVGKENVPYAPPQDQIDWNLPRIPLHWEANDGNRYDWELIPLKSFDDATDEACFDKLLVFEAPEDHVEYTIGIDTAHGNNLPNEDRGHVAIYRKKTDAKPEFQVAAFTSIQINSAQMSRIAAAIAVFFATDGNGSVTSDNPLVAKFIIEQVRKAGDECQHQLKLMGFLDHHIMHFYDKTGNIDPTKGTYEGWRTTRWSRSILLNRFVTAITTGWMKVNDPITIRQLKTFELYIKNGFSEMGHAQGEHDDNIFGSAMCWTAAHDLDNQALLIAGDYTPPNILTKTVQNNEWASNAVSID